MDDFERVYREYYPSVYRFTLGLSRDPSLAEELTQEAFFRAIKKIDEFRGTCSLNTWLCQIAKNLYFSHTRKFGRVQALLSHIGRHEENPERVEDELETQEEAKKLHRALHHLQEPHKEVFSLRVFAELSFREIGALFGKTESWARVTYYRAKLKLQDAIEEGNHE